MLIGEARTVRGGRGRLAEHGVDVTVLDDGRCATTMGEFVAAHPGFGTTTSGASRSRPRDPALATPLS